MHADLKVAHSLPSKKSNLLRFLQMSLGKQYSYHWISFPKQEFPKVLDCCSSHDVGNPVFHFHFILIKPHSNFLYTYKLVGPVQTVSTFDDHQDRYLMQILQAVNRIVYALEIEPHTYWINGAICVTIDAR